MCSQQVNYRHGLYIFRSQVVVVLKDIQFQSLGRQYTYSRYFHIKQVFVIVIWKIARCNG